VTRSSSRGDSNADGNQIHGYDHSVRMKTQDTIANLSALEGRARAISDWLKENGRGCFDEQKHLDQDSQERIYWHYGYLVAMRDVYRYLTGEPLPSRVPRIQQRDTDG
jgi:hypothetical protein